MLIFFIDGASYIALDGNWYYFLVYQDKKLVAYSTVYEQKRPMILGKSKSLSKTQNKARKI